MKNVKEERSDKGRTFRKKKLEKREKISFPPPTLSSWNPCLYKNIHTVNCICCVITSCPVVKDRSKFDTWLNLVRPPLSHRFASLPHRPNGGLFHVRGNTGRRERMETACRLRVTHISRCVSEFDICLICMCHTLTHKHTHTHTHTPQCYFIAKGPPLATPSFHTL